MSAEQNEVEVPASVIVAAMEEEHQYAAKVALDRQMQLSVQVRMLSKELNSARQEVSNLRAERDAMAEQLASALGETEAMDSAVAAVSREDDEADTSMTG